MLENSQKQINSLLPYVFCVAVFFAAIAVTDANFWADSADYVDSVVAFRLGKNYNFWEFGHLFWRPANWFIWSHFFSAADENLWRAEAMTVFQAMTYVSAIFSTVVLTGILKKIKIPVWLICLTTICFVCSHAFLNFAQAGTSYIPALMFYLLGLYLALCQPNRQSIFVSILSGVCLALTICFWVPFLWALPAVIGSRLVLYDFDRRNSFVALIQMTAFLAVLGLAYATVLLVLQFDSLSDIKTWVTAASHGNETRGVARMIFGLARSFVNMGNDGVLFKRYLLKDAYNPVSLAVLVGKSLWKVAAFYGLVAGVLFLLWKNERDRRILVLLIVAALPVLIFAALFDGGAVERYLPLFPFAFISLAAALKAREYKLLRSVMILILVAFALVNLNALSIWKASEQQERFVSRVFALETKAASGDQIFLVNWTDDLINFNRSYPFHPINLRGRLKFGAVVTPGSTQTKQWREEFAARSLRAWASGENVWLAANAFSQKPEADSNWTEGDDKNVTWQEFPEFFGKLETGEKLGGENGFVLISPSDSNRKYLQEYKERFTEEIKF